MAQNTYFWANWGWSSTQKNTKNAITQNWFEILQPNFYHLKISREVNFPQNLKSVVWKMTLPRPWPFQTSQGHGRLIFWVTPSKFGVKTHLLKMYKWCVIMILIPQAVSDLKKSGWAAPYISVACTWPSINPKKFFWKMLPKGLN